MCNDTASDVFYTLSLHDALPISSGEVVDVLIAGIALGRLRVRHASACRPPRTPGVTERTGIGNLPLHCPDWVGKVCQWARSEEHTSELQSQFHLVCRLLLEKKKK